MPIPFVCPSCSANLRAPDNMAGHKIKCSKCGAAVVVPSPVCGIDDDDLPISGNVAIRGPHTPDEEADYAPPSRAVLPILGWVLTIVFFGLAIIFAVASSQSSQRAEKLQNELDQLLGRTRPLVAQTEPSMGLPFAFWLGLTLFLLAGYVLSTILLLAWVARDARSRSVDGGAVWVIVILFTWWFGFLVYLASRPHGMLVVCPRCTNKKLNYALLCPHCGAKSGSKTHAQSVRVLRRAT